MTVKEESIINVCTGEVGETQGMKEIKGYDDKLKSARVKMDEVKKENKLLKLSLSQKMENYQSLKMHIHELVQQINQSKGSSLMASSNDDESNLVSLTLGRFSGDSCKREDKKVQENVELDGLELGLDSKFHLNDSSQASKINPSPENSFDHEKSPTPKTERSEDDEVLEQNPLKKPRVSVRAVCDTQTMNDGCQWRKYGQKIAKGNPCPRAYYRCTVSPSCPVRKQVQRCVDDMSILITTYEGTHNHPLSASATTMASATTAAATMLKCGSSTSTPNHHGFNFSASSNNNLKNSYFPRASVATSLSHPTVILDLTIPNYQYSSQYNKSYLSSFATSTNSFIERCSNALQLARESKFYSNKNCIETSYPYNVHGNTQEEEIVMSRDKIAAATKAMTHDPTFQSALAAAITSFVGNVNDHQERKSGPNNSNIKLDDKKSTFELSFSHPAAHANSYLNKFPQSSLDSQHQSLTSSYPGHPFALSAASKSRFMSTLADEGEQIKL
ncbi:hypothetical protein ACJIZ3_025203 [Penstemon smallii]|uniref:WRKY domain-containing protein n=1 Tax=Penstemon smallii TaxID=265156 RepID=A0ABD3TUZ3_9LAMI